MHLGSALCNVFIIDLGDGTLVHPQQFDGDAKLGVTDGPCHGAVILTTLEKCANRNLMKSYKGEDFSPQAPEQAGGSSEGGQVAAVCSWTAPGLHEAGEGCDPSLLHWTDPSGSLGPLDFPVQERHGNTGTSPVRGHSDA